MRKALVTAALLVALAVGLTLAGLATAQGANQVEVTLTEFKIDMSATSIPAGVPVTLTATNKGQTLHEVVLERAGADDQPLEMNGKETEIEDIGPGETKSATWIITEPGVYQLACHVPGHFEAGMVQRFTVTAAARAGQATTAMQIAAPSSENLAEQKSQPPADATMAMSMATPSTLPVTGAATGPSALWWVGAALVALLAAVAGAFRLILNQIK